MPGPDLHGSATIIAGSTLICLFDPSEENLETQLPGEPVAIPYATILGVLIAENYNTPTAITDENTKRPTRRALSLGWRGRFGP